MFISDNVLIITIIRIKYTVKHERTVKKYPSRIKGGTDRRNILLLFVEGVKLLDLFFDLAYILVVV